MGPPARSAGTTGSRAPPRRSPVRRPRPATAARRSAGRCRPTAVAGPAGDRRERDGVARPPRRAAAEAPGDGMAGSREQRGLRRRRPRRPTAARGTSRSSSAGDGGARAPRRRPPGRPPAGPGRTSERAVQRDRPAQPHAARRGSRPAPPDGRPGSRRWPCPGGPQKRSATVRVGTRPIVGIGGTAGWRSCARSVFDSFAGPLEVREVPAPDPAPDGVVVRVARERHLPQRLARLAGPRPRRRAAARARARAGRARSRRSGPASRRWRGRRPGDRAVRERLRRAARSARRAITRCAPRQTQPGFTHWGSLARARRARRGGRQPGRRSAMSSTLRHAAALGCRYATAFRAVVQHGPGRPGEWVAVHGCGGVGLSAVQIAAAAGRRVVAVDVAPGALELARDLGAEHRGAAAGRRARRRSSSR